MNLKILCLFMLYSMLGSQVLLAQDSPHEYRIVFDPSPMDRFPAQWNAPEIAISATPLATSEYDRTKYILEDALSKYPSKILGENLRETVVVQELGFSGVSASGTNSRDQIFLANGGVKKGFTAKWLERVFHSEFSSILLRNHYSDFRDDRWNSLNPESFEYGEGGIAAVKKGEVGRFFDSKLLKQGFLSQYATSSLENDFNAFAGFLWLGEEKLWDASEKHSAVAVKLKLTIDFYQSLDNSIDTDFFVGLATSERFSE